MRHHGAPSRLLDATYSIFVAAYFAIQHSEPNEDAAVWIFDQETCQAEAVTAAKAANLDGGNLEWETTFESEAQKAQVLLDNQGKFRAVCPINPFRLNERLTIQRGVFLAPADVTSSFEKNLDALTAREASVTPIIILRASFPAISIELHRMNISEATLFPGLDGYARSLISARRFIENQRPDRK